MYSVAGGMQVYSVAGGIQVYSVTNYNTCCFLLQLQLSENYIQEAEFGFNIHSTSLATDNRQTTIVI